MVYTLRGVGGAQVQVTNLGARVISPEIALPPSPCPDEFWESRVETDWVVMTCDAPDGRHFEMGFWLDDEGILEVTLATSADSATHQKNRYSI